MTSTEPEDLPDWLILLGETRQLIERFRADVEAAAARFRALDDVRAAIEYRQRHVPKLLARVDDLNRRVREVNLLVPRVRFQLFSLDAEKEVAPLAKAYFKR